MKTAKLTQYTTSKKWLVMISVILTLTLFLSGCGKEPASNEEIPDQSDESIVVEQPIDDPNYVAETIYSNDKNPIVTIEMENGHIIKVELYPDVAPNTVNSFISLTNKGFYDGVIFHRVISNFMIQGGDPEGTGGGGPGYRLKAEFTAAGFVNELHHERGVISMGRLSAANPADAYDTAGSQFFIVHKDSPHLDGLYTSFGKVIEGIGVVDLIAATKTGAADRPLEEQKMKRVTVETFGITYDEPEIIVE